MPQKNRNEGDYDLVFILGLILLFIVLFWFYWEIGRVLLQH